MAEDRCKNFVWFNEGECAIQCGTPLNGAIKASQKPKEEVLKALEGVTLPSSGIYYCSTCLPSATIYYSGNKTLVQRKPKKVKRTFCRNLFCNEENTDRSPYCKKHEDEYELVNERKRLDNRGAFPLCFVKPFEPSSDVDPRTKEFLQAKSSEGKSSDSSLL